MAYTTIPASPGGGGLPSGTGIVKVTGGVGGLATPGTDYLTTCGLTLIQTQTIAVEVAAVTFSGLNGDADLAYDFRIDGIGGANSTTADSCTLRPNGVSTNLFSQGQFTQGLGTSTTTSNLGANTVAYISLGGAPTMSWGAQGTIYAKSGKQRAYLVTFTQWDTATAGTRCGAMTGFWSDTSTNVTSLQFFASHNMFGVGTLLSLWKRAT